MPKFPSGVYKVWIEGQTKTSVNNWRENFTLAFLRERVFEPHNIIGGVEKNNSRQFVGAVSVNEDFETVVIRAANSEFIINSVRLVHMESNTQYYFPIYSTKTKARYLVAISNPETRKVA